MRAKLKDLKWISVKDSLPSVDDEGLFLVHYETGAVSLDGICRIGDHCFFAGSGAGHGKVTHWMPLPEGPEEFFCE